MNERVRDAIDYTLIVGGFTMAAIGVIGEIARLVEAVSRAAEPIGLGQILGWWNDLGLVFTIAGLLTGTWGTLDVNGRALVGIVRPMASSIGDLHTSIEGLHGKQDRMLEKQDEARDELARIGDILGAGLPE